MTVIAFYWRFVSTRDRFRLQAVPLTHKMHWYPPQDMTDSGDAVPNAVQPLNSSPLRLRNPSFLLKSTTASNHGKHLVQYFHKNKVLPLCRDTPM